MDWLSEAHYAMLQREWQALVQRALPDTRLLWRSGGFQVDYIDPLEVRAAGRRCRVGDLLTYHHDLAAQLHAHDRVHTYGSFYVADLAVP
jgi:S-adenosylmethionine-diacylglycerol 3-amino-3-carboxypropyl transferase